MSDPGESTVLRLWSCTFMVGGLLLLSACASEPPPAPVMAPPPPPPPPTPAPLATPAPQPTMAPQMVVVRGSPNALAWYPLGRRVAVGANICLPENARFITFEKLGGGTVTYGGGGCNKLIAEPPSDPNARSGAGSGP